MGGIVHHQDALQAKGQEPRHHPSDMLGFIVGGDDGDNARKAAQGFTLLDPEAIGDCFGNGWPVQAEKRAFWASVALTLGRI